MATAKKAAPAKKGAEDTRLQGYCMATKQMEPINEVKIKCTNRRYIASGTTDDGHKVTKIMSATQAQEAIDADLAELVEEAPAKKAAAPAKKK